MTLALSKMTSFLRWLHGPVAVTFLATFLVNLALVTFNFVTYRMWNFDLAWMTSVVKSYAELREPVVPFMGEYFPALGNHFSPVLALASPFYAIFPQSYTLNVLMALCFALSAAILAGSAKKLLGTKYAYGLGLGLGLSWGFLSASSGQFHEYALGAPILAYSLALFMEKNYFRAAIVSGFLIFVKEDVGLLLVALGVVFALRAKNWKYLLLSLWGGFWVFFTIKVFIPTVSGEWDFSGTISPSLETLTSDLLTKAVLILFLLLQGGVIGLRSPLAYTVLLFVGARLLTTWSSYYIVGYHYDTLTIILASFALLDSLHRGSWKPTLKRMAVALPFLAALIYLVFPIPGSTTAWATRDYSEDKQVISSYEGLFEAIPEGVIVAADNTTIAGFLDRGFTTYFTRALEDKTIPDCIVGESRDIFSADGSLFTSVDELEKLHGKTYELTYESPYINAWCSEE